MRGRETDRRSVLKAGSSVAVALGLTGCLEELPVEDEAVSDFGDDGTGSTAVTPTGRASKAPTETAASTDEGGTDTPAGTATPADGHTPTETATPADTETQTPAGNDEYEPNDRFDDATPVEYGDYIGLVVDDGDSDVFVTTVEEDVRLNVSIAYAMDAPDPELVAYGPDRNRIAGGTETGTGQEINAGGDLTGTCYVEVSGTGSDLVSYDMYVRYGAAEEDENEPDDDFDSATEITEGSYTDLAIMDGDTDFFATHVEATQHVTASISFSHDVGDLDLWLYDPDRNEVAASETTSDGETITTNARQTGTYYLEVDGFFGASAPYDLTLAFAENDAYAINDDFDSAAEITPGTYTGLEKLAGESDFFATHVEEGQDLTVSISFSDDASNLDVSIYDPDRNEIEYSYSNTDDESISATATRSGTYYVEVYSLYDGSAPYDLTIEVS